MAVNLRKYRLSKLENKEFSPNYLKNRRQKIIKNDFLSSILGFLGLTSQALLFFTVIGVCLTFEPHLFNSKINIKTMVLIKKMHSIGLKWITK
ncbi:hypothetical protein [Enterococcus sp. DIV0212c]|uniref:hypothetical protein n=1 Tax=Enterococcus sp. DIV0212c TaxID=2230867 RepID=UPI0035C85B16